MMKVREILARLTGISTPFGGISWKPSQTERSVAQHVITELEDRRVLFDPYQWELPAVCRKSVQEIRTMLKQQLHAVDADSELAKSLRGILGVCREFLTSTSGIALGPAGITNYPISNQLEFGEALGRLRGQAGIYIAWVAAMHGIDVHDELAISLPPLPDETDETDETDE